MGGQFKPLSPGGGAVPTLNAGEFAPPIKAPLVRAPEPWSLQSGATALRLPQPPKAASAGPGEGRRHPGQRAGLCRKRRRGGPGPPLPSSGSPPARRPSLAARQELHRGARGEWERRPGGLQLGRPRRRRAGRVRTAGAPDLAGGGVSKALCLMASVYRVTL